ncbi:MAG: hypothetical protein R3A44_02530 [Caldilineaceae bacterium]
MAQPTVISAAPPIAAPAAAAAADAPPTVIPAMPTMPASSIMTPSSARQSSQPPAEHHGASVSGHGPALLNMLRISGLPNSASTVAAHAAASLHRAKPGRRLRQAQLFTLAAICPHSGQG